MNNATITLQFGTEEREIEVYFNHTPSVPAEGLFPGSKEEFEIIKLFDIENQDWLFDEDDTGCLLEVMHGDIVNAIKEDRLDF